MGGKKRRVAALVAKAEVGADAPPSRFGEGGPLPPPVAADHRGPVAGLLREVTKWSVDGGDRQIKGLVGDRCIGKKNRPPPGASSNCNHRSVLTSPLTTTTTSDNDNNDNDDDGGNEDGGNNDNGKGDDDNGGDDNARRGGWMGKRGIVHFKTAGSGQDDSYPVRRRTTALCLLDSGGG